jgi:restriction endonuclease Mrr
MLPMLQALTDGVNHSTADLVATLAKHFALYEDANRQWTPDGRTFRARVQYARKRLLGVGLVESLARGTLCITARGKRVLMKSPDRINIHALQDAFDREQVVMDDDYAIEDDQDHNKFLPTEDDDDGDDYDADRKWDGGVSFNDPYGNEDFDYEVDD